MSLVTTLYGTAARVAAPALRVMLNRRVKRGKEVAARLPERFGISGLPRPAGRLAWIHAASVGETMSVLPVIAALAGTQVLLTTGTVTSAALAAARLPGHARHQFVPLDVPGWVAAFLDHWRPDAAVFVESEIWPNLLRAVDARGIPRVLINASMSNRSFGRWKFIARAADILLFGFRYVHVQSAADAAKFQALGAAGILDWGNLKFAAPALPVDDAALAAMRAAIPGPKFLAASTHPGEEDFAIAAHEILLETFPDLVTIIVPRHPERGAEFSYPRRSLSQMPVAGGIYVADTLGELGLFFRLCPFVFMGGSLVDIGGHNISEPARLGRPVLTGPHTKEITELVEQLAACRGIIEVLDAPTLAAAALTWLEQPNAARDAGVRAQAAFAGLDELPAKLAKLILEASL